MNKVLLLGLALAAVVSLQAAGSAQNETGQASSGKKSVSAEIQGCLRQSQGQYILVDKDNTFQRLSNYRSLKQLVGHEVRLTGKPEIRTIDTTPPGGASSSIEQRYFQVKSAVDVSPNCAGYPE
jgi:hypothetical protein